VEEALEDSECTVNHSLLEKLNAATPARHIVRHHLEEIAKEFNVDWHAPDEESDSHESAHGHSPPSSKPISNATLAPSLSLAPPPPPPAAAAAAAATTSPKVLQVAQPNSILASPSFPVVLIDFPNTKPAAVPRPVPTNTNSVDSLQFPSVPPSNVGAGAAMNGDGFDGLLFPSPPANAPGKSSASSSGDADLDDLNARLRRLKK